MKILFKLREDWKNGEAQFKKGDRLEAEESDIQHLLEEGIAEKIDKEQLRKDGVGIAVRDANDKPDLATIVKEVVDGELKEIKAVNKQEMLHREEKEYDKTGSFESFGEFIKDVVSVETNKSTSDKLRKWVTHTKVSGMSEGINADGGFLIPTEFRAQLLMDTLESQLLRPRCFNIPISGNTVKIPSVNATTHAGSTFGGIALYRPNEGVQKTGSAPKFAQVTLSLNKLVGLCYATDELIEDSPITLAPLLSRMFTEAISFQTDHDILNGSGAGEPLGVINAPCLVSVAKETGQPATTIESANIDKMFSRLKPRSLGKAIWIAAPDTFPQLASLQRAVGTGGSAAGLVQSIPQAPYMTMLGRPLFLTEHCPTLGQVGDIIFGDFSQYLFAEKGGVKVDSSIHLKFDYDETAFRFVMRYDGQPWETSALTPANSSSSTLSSFVALAIRE